MDYRDIYDIGFEAIRGYWSQKERFDFFTTDASLNLATQNEVKISGIVPFRKWKVVALGLYCAQSTTANEAPVIHMGHSEDVDGFGIITVTATASKLVAGYSWLETHAAGYGNILPATIRKGETAAQAVVTWSEAGAGSDFNIEQTTPQLLQIKATAAGISTGRFYGIFVVENLNEREYR